MPIQIITLGGGGFSMEPDNLALDRYILAQTGKARPRVCFLPQAGGENQDYIVRFYNAFSKLDARAAHLSLFQPHTADIADFLQNQDVIYVGGGNTKSMLALWREWGLPAMLRAAAENGTVLAGISAGAICWYEQGLTDSIPGNLTPLACLGFLPGSATPHYDGEAARRPTYLQLVRQGVLPAGYALPDSAAAHWVDGRLLRCVCSVAGKQVYRVEPGTAEAQEIPQAMLLLN